MLLVKKMLEQQSEDHDRSLWFNHNSQDLICIFVFSVAEANAHAALQESQAKWIRVGRRGDGREEGQGQADQQQVGKHAFKQQGFS